MTRTKARELKARYNAVLGEYSIVLAGPVVDALVKEAADVYRPKKKQHAPEPNSSDVPHSATAEITPHQELTGAVAVACHLLAGPYAARAAAQLEDAIPGRDPALIRQMARDVLALYVEPSSWWFTVRCAGLEHKQAPSPDALVKTIGLALEWQRARSTEQVKRAPGGGLYL